MRLEDLKFELRGPQTGMSVYDDTRYLGTYGSVHELMLDLIYRFEVDDLDEIVKNSRLANQNIIEPFKYRGVCSELFWPTDKSMRYIYYCNTLSELFDKFAIHERRAAEHEDVFSYGAQGTGIYIFNKATLKYEFWVGGNELHTVEDVMNEVKKQGLTIPSSFEEEYDPIVINELTTGYDVFVSHKSDDYKIAERVYDTLLKEGLNVFLSEKSLPAIANADYIAEIDKALENTRHLIVIASDVENINSGWVRYEWSSFLNEKLSGRKNGNIITVVTNNISFDKLPLGLRHYEVINVKDISSLPKWFLR